MTDEDKIREEQKKYLENQLHENQERIHKLTYYNPITFLPNRKKLIKKFNESIESPGEMKEKGIILLDIDRFHSINELYGRAVGDCVLFHIAKRLKGLFKKDFSVFHDGADEFLIYHDEAEYDALEKMGETIIDTITKPFTIGEKKFSVAASIGMSHYPKTGLHIDALLNQAEIAMLSVKNSTKNNFKIFEPDDALTISRKNQLEFDLALAPENNELFLVYQPKVELETGRMVAVEALARWEHPELGLISPLEFIVIAEETGLIIEIGRWIIYEAVRQTKEWHDAGYKLTTSVNISAVQFNDSQFVCKVVEILEEVGLDPCYLIFEITESVCMDFEYTEMMVKQLKELGIRMALDDFGTGFSSLKLLKDSSFDLLKVDKTFIDEVPKDSFSSTVLGGLIQVANELGLSTLAEGVEEAIQSDFLIKKGYRYGQGYLFSRPVLPPQIITYIHSHGLA